MGNTSQLPSLVLVGILFLLSASIATDGHAAKIEPKQYNNLPVVILKIDDLKYYTPGDDADQAWDRFLAYIRKKNLKANIGAIGEHFDKDAERSRLFYADVKSAFLQGSSIEIFNHSYCYCPEKFTDVSPYQVQYDTLDRAQKAIESKLGIIPIGFGSGGNKKSADTITVMNRHPNMKVWFFGDDRVDSGKVINLKRSWPLSNIDSIESSDAFLESFEKFRDNAYIVLQGHAGKWSSGQFNSFVKAIDKLLARYPNLKFMTLTEYYDYSGGTDSTDILGDAQVPPSAPTNLIIDVEL